MGVASYAGVLMARHALFHPQGTSAETDRYLRSPITTHFSIKEANFGLKEILQDFNSTDTSVAFQRVCGH